jgi:formate--tetrahydrofolate ligase
MANKSDLEIAQETEMKDIKEIAASAGIDEKYLELYGNYKAKLSYDINSELKDRRNGKLILVTAVSPTPAGEGKTTTSIGLADGLHRIGKNCMAALREPSMGPVFGIKGGAAGGGYAQVVPMEDINLHFTGDMHAIGAANNLIAACLDNSIIKGNKLGIDPRRVVWKRCVDMNDRQLRYVVDGLGGPVNGVPREDGFEITVASQIMADLCLADDITDLKARIGRSIVAFTYDDKPVTVSDLKVEGAAAAILKDAVKPNLVQTLEGTPVLIHGGPFANIAHGCNSVIATKTALKLADYVVTEAGFAADLGAEKFLDIKCRQTGLKPDACVLVATVRSMKYQGGVAKEDLNKENVEAVRRGMPNLKRHLDNMKNVFGIPTVVAINKFYLDTPAELEVVKEECAEMGVDVIESNVWAEGGAGGTDLAQAVVRLCDEKSDMKLTYGLDMTIKEKIEAVASKIYRADGVDYTAKAEKDIARLEKLGFGKLAVCMAKTQYSFTDDPKKLCAPEGFRITVTEAYVSAGAGFVVVKTGNIMTMPGLPSVPAAENIDIDAEGKISGLF